MGTFPASPCRFNHIEGEAAVMQQAYVRTTRADQTDAAVQLRRESGSGKQLIARSAHFNSERREHSCMVMDCTPSPLS